jgi:hypothetical protein
LLRLPAFFFLVIAALIAGTAFHVRAALDGGVPAADGGVQLIVLEVKDCYACDLVRQHIQPAYARYPQSREVPLRYVDLNTVGAESLGLAGPITMVPTIVLMRDGQEVSRIAGYTGPAIFFEAVEQMLARID